MALADSVVFACCLVMTLVLVVAMFDYAMVLHLKMQFDQMGALLFSEWSGKPLEEESIALVEERLTRLGFESIGIESWEDEKRHLMLTGNLERTYRTGIFDRELREQTFRFYRVLPGAN